MKIYLWEGVDNGYQHFQGRLSTTRMFISKRDICINEKWIRIQGTDHLIFDGGGGGVGGGGWLFESARHFFWPRRLRTIFVPNSIFFITSGHARYFFEFATLQGRRYRGCGCGGGGVTPPNNSNVGQSWSKWN